MYKEKRKTPKTFIPEATLGLLQEGLCIYFQVHCNSYTATAKSLQSCPTLCDPVDGSPPGSTIPGILQARVLEWGAIAFSTYIHYYI